MPKRRIRTTPRLIVFAKVPRPGAVKTRIASTVGKGRAAEIYRAMLSGFVARLRTLRRKWQVEIHYSPASDEFYLIPEVPLTLPRVPQIEGDLGARLGAAFQGACSSRRDPVVICGSDAPDVPLDYLVEATERLATNDIVLGPCPDGGFYLIGMTRPIPQIFEGVAWSTPNVLESTLARIRALGLTHHLTPAWSDVDTIEDVLAFLARRPVDPRARRIQNRIRATLAGTVELPPPAV